MDSVLAVQRGMAVHTGTPRPPVGLTPHAVVHVQDKLQVRYYAPAKPSGPPVVLVPSLINKAWILDLEPDRSLVASLAAMGHPTYLVDWGEPCAEDANEDVGYVVLELLNRAVDRICRHARAPKCVLFGYCMGGTLAGMLAAVRPKRIAALALLNAPFRFAQAGRFRDFVQRFDVERAIDEDGLVPVEVMQPAFKMLDPVGNWTKYKAIEQASHEPDRLARVMARERWLEENVPMTGAFAREFITMGYQQDRLLEGTWSLNGELVDLERIQAPTLVVACENDFVSPAPACLAVSERIVHAEVRLLPIGHIGVVVGGFGPKVFYPLLSAWIREATA